MVDPILEICYRDEAASLHTLWMADCLFEIAEAWMLENMGITKEQIIYIVRVESSAVNQKGDHNVSQ